MVITDNRKSPQKGGLLEKHRLLLNASLDPNLSPGDTRVFLWMVELWNYKTGFAWPSIGSVAKHLSCDRSTIKRAIRRLRQNGWLIIKQRGHGQEPTHYDLAWDRCGPSSFRGKSVWAPHEGAEEVSNLYDSDIESELSERSELIPYTPYPAYKNHLRKTGRPNAEKLISVSVGAPIPVEVKVLIAELGFSDTYSVWRAWCAKMERLAGERVTLDEVLTGIRAHCQILLEQDP